MLKPTYTLPALPPPLAVETPAILRAAAKAHRHLAEVKGRAASIPNPGILIDTLSIQEALASSEIENIVTTQDEAFQATIFADPDFGPAKEVALYRSALKCGFELMQRQQGLLTNNTMIEMFRVLKRSTAGFRDTPGTALKNDRTGEIVFVPPQDRNEIKRHMAALETFINNDSELDLDPLLKMAIIHHQFESIHPFPDGNGRLGRIINVLYLTQAGLLDSPILYLSRYINETKDEYYRLLQAVRDHNDWERWILYMLDAVAQTSIRTLATIEQINSLMQDYKHRIRTVLPKIYSHDLLNNMFRNPYTKIEFVQDDLCVTRQTASRYLEQLVDEGFLTKHTVGKGRYFTNDPLLDIFLKS